MTALLVTLAGAYGVHLIYTAVALNWRGLAPGPSLSSPKHRTSRWLRSWMMQAGLEEARLQELAGAAILLFVIGAAITYAIFGGVVSSFVGGVFATTFPIAAAKARREQRRNDAREAWPRLIEEIRLTTVSLGRSVPQALFDVGARAPEEMRAAFEASHREWVLSTDFQRTIAVLKDRLSDATADAVCETLLVAHEIGGNNIDRCLTALMDDRIVDLQGRKDARSRQAGARFARKFVLIVPLGMALIGMSIGQGRSAYSHATGQLLVMSGLAVMAGCWVWAGQIMRLPNEQRVFNDA